MERVFEIIRPLVLRRQKLEILQTRIGHNLLPVSLGEALSNCFVPGREFDEAKGMSLLLSASRRESRWDLREKVASRTHPRLSLHRAMAASISERYVRSVLSCASSSARSHSYPLRYGAAPASDFRMTSEEM